MIMWYITSNIKKYEIVNYANKYQKMKDENVLSARTLNPKGTE